MEVIFHIPHAYLRIFYLVGVDWPSFLQWLILGGFLAAKNGLCCCRGKSPVSVPCFFSMTARSLVSASTFLLFFTALFSGCNASLELPHPAPATHIVNFLSSTHLCSESWPLMLHFF